MSKRKTALQQAIEDIQVEIDKWELDSPSVVRGALLRAREICKEHLETERQDIIDAWDDGLNKGYTGDKGDAHDYFTSKYESNG